MTKIYRSACEPGGVLNLDGNRKPLPRETAYLTRAWAGEPFRHVTWAEILAKRRERQAERLRSIRWSSERRAVRITVQFYGNGLMGGWHCYIDGAGDKGGGGRGFAQWQRYDIGDLIAAFPLWRAGELLRAVEKYEWMRAFVEAYPAGTFNGKPRGAVYAWAECEGRTIRKCMDQ